MNSLKVVCVTVVLALVALLWVQNRDSAIALQLFCPDPTSDSCLYRSPTLTIGVWMILFTVAGAVSNILSQLLAQAGISSRSIPSRPRNTVSEQFPHRARPDISEPKRPTKPPTTSLSDWEQESSPDWDGASSRTLPSKPDPRTERFEKKTESSSDSIYSYRVRDSAQSDRKEREIVDKPVPPPQERKPKKNEVDDVYDATYRTVGSPQPPKSEDEDDEQWI